MRESFICILYIASYTWEPFLMLLCNAQSFSSAYTIVHLASFTKQSNVSHPYPSPPISSSCHQSVSQNMAENHFPSDRCFTRGFPGDPCFATWIIPTSDDVSSLPCKVFLSAHLLDCILQFAACSTTTKASVTQLFSYWEPSYLVLHT